MDPLKNLYQSWVREELDSPDVKAARDAFLAREFSAKPIPATGPFWALPAFRLAMVGCLALFVVLKINLIDHATITDIQSGALIQEEIIPLQTAPLDSLKGEMPQTQIKKMGSQMGAMMAYQKSFPDVQITVVWVIPKGV